MKAARISASNCTSFVMLTVSLENRSHEYLYFYIYSRRKCVLCVAGWNISWSRLVSIEIWKWQIFKCFILNIVAWWYFHASKENRQQNPIKGTTHVNIVSQSNFLLPWVLSQTPAWYLVQSHWDSMWLIELFEENRTKDQNDKTCYFFQKSVFFHFEKCSTIQKTLKIVCYLKDTK